MGITKHDIKELIELTMRSCPLPPVADILCAIGEDDADIMISFIKKYYTEEQIMWGLKEYRSRVELVQKMFGGKNGHNDQESKTENRS